MKIKFDYSFDSNGFFNSVERRSALEKAGEIWSNLLKDEFDNIPIGSQFTISNPVTGATETIVLDTEIDDLVIFVGGTSSLEQISGNSLETGEQFLSGTHLKVCCCSTCVVPVDSTIDLSQRSILGEDNSNSTIVLAKAKVDGGDLQGDIFQRRISNNFRNTGEVVTDFEPWAGTIAFNSTANWNFDLEEADASKRDFISVALHEIAHILGIGTAGIFDSLITNNLFQGVNSLAINNSQGVPVDQTSGHVSEEFSNNQVLLDPTLNDGRNAPSNIDLALLADIGYEITGFNKQGFLIDIATEQAEQILGTNLSDMIDGLGGDDSIQGDDGNDTIYGGSGEDTIAGNTGKDLIFGDDNGDSLDGGSDNDTIYGGTGKDLIFGNDGNDLLFGESDNDELQGGNGNDSLQGGVGNDTIFGQEGNDLVIGNDGNDHLQGGNGNDSLQGGVGNDTILGEAGNDLINGNSGSDLLLGGAGSDRFVFDFGTGNDAINDFVVGEDIIEVAPEYGFTNGSKVFAAITQTGTSSNTDQLFSQVTLNSGNIITIFHDKALSASDFTIGTAKNSTPLTITTFETTASGFILQFNKSLKTGVLNLYDGQDGSVDSPDLTVVSNTTGEKVRGSLIWNETDLSLTFVQSGGILEGDRYTLMASSGANAFISSTGELLDGDNDGIAGGDFITQFTVESNQGRVLGIEDFSRGTGETVKVSGEDGLAISLDNGQGVTKVEFTLNYDEDILGIKNVIVDPDLGGNWTLTKDLSTPGKAVVKLQGTSALASGAVDLVQLVAEVPETAEYGASGLLELESVRLNQGSISVFGDTAIQQVISLGDASGDGRYTGFDVSLISQVAAGFYSGFDASPLIDPNLVADLTGDNNITAFDASLVAREIV